MSVETKRVVVKENWIQNWRLVWALVWNTGSLYSVSRSRRRLSRGQHWCVGRELRAEDASRGVDVVVLSGVALIHRSSDCRISCFRPQNTGFCKHFELLNTDCHWQTPLNTCPLRLSLFPITFCHWIQSKVAIKCSFDLTNGPIMQSWRTACKWSQVLTDWSPLWSDLINGNRFAITISSQISSSTEDWLPIGVNFEPISTWVVPNQLQLGLTLDSHLSIRRLS